MIVSHVGIPWVEETCLLMQKNPNIYADIAGINYTSTNKDNMARILIMAKEHRVIHKCFWGTDGPNAEVSGGKVNRYGNKGWDAEVPHSYTRYLDLVRVDTNKYAEKHDKEPLTQAEIDNILGLGVAKLLGLKV